MTYKRISDNFSDIAKYIGKNERRLEALEAQVEALQKPKPRVNYTNKPHVSFNEIELRLEIEEWKAKSREFEFKTWCLKTELALAKHELAKELSDE